MRITKRNGKNTVKETQREFNNPPKTGSNGKSKGFRYLAYIQIMAQVSPYIFLGVWGILASFNIIGALGGLTLEAWLLKTIPMPIDYIEETSQGQYFHRDSGNAPDGAGASKDEVLMLKIGLKAHRIIFKRRIKVAYKTVMAARVFADCTYDPGKSKKRFGMVLSRITLNRNECGKDNAMFNGRETVPLYSSLTVTKTLEAGEEYILRAEGLFFGTVDNHSAAMQLKLTRHSDVSYGEYARSRKLNYRPVSSNVDNMGKVAAKAKTSTEQEQPVTLSKGHTRSHVYGYYQTLTRIPGPYQLFTPYGLFLALYTLFLLAYFLRRAKGLRPPVLYGRW
ncbi:MAG: MotA/TolQ/ExbB proton channel family protein [bacterium]|nr:MotA/TolQ/ExbB proton channel family protein [bacterium]